MLNKVESGIAAFICCAMHKEEPSAPMTGLRSLDFTGAQHSPLKPSKGNLARTSLLSNISTPLSIHRVGSDGDQR